MSSPCSSTIDPAEIDERDKIENMLYGPERQSANDLLDSVENFEDDLKPLTISNSVQTSTSFQNISFNDFNFSNVPEIHFNDTSSLPQRTSRRRRRNRLSRSQEDAFIASSLGLSPQSIVIRNRTEDLGRRLPRRSSRIRNREQNVEQNILLGNDTITEELHDEAFIAGYLYRMRRGPY